MNNIKENKELYILLFMRVSLAIAFLSAVADRFGLWGSAGSNGVAWGNFENFVEYVAYLNPYFSSRTVFLVSYLVTLLEIILGIFLIFGFFLRQSSFLSFLLLLSFALSMGFIGGFKGVFDYSVFTASAGALVLFLYLEKEASSK